MKLAPPQDSIAPFSSFFPHAPFFFSAVMTFVHHSPLDDFIILQHYGSWGEHNLFTGRLRRSPKSNLTRKRHSSHGLDVKTRDFLRGTVHPNIIHWMGQAALQGNMVSVYMACHILVQFQYQDDHQLEEEALGTSISRNCECLECLNNSHTCGLISIDDIKTELLKAWFKWCVASEVCEYWKSVDAVLGDIPELVEATSIYTEPWFHQINDFYNDDQAVCKTAFTKDELCQLMGLFGLNEMIRVPRADGKYDSFHPEELFLFTLMKLREGGSNAAIIEDQVGGRSASRWG
jgi:hypothetical protein